MYCKCYTLPSQTTQIKTGNKTTGDSPAQPAKLDNNSEFNHTVHRVVNVFVW